MENEEEIEEIKIRQTKSPKKNNTIIWATVLSILGLFGLGLYYYLIFYFLM